MLLSAEGRPRPPPLSPRSRSLDWESQRMAATGAGPSIEAALFRSGMYRDVK